MQGNDNRAPGKGNASRAASYVSLAPKKACGESRVLCQAFGVGRGMWKHALWGAHIGKSYSYCPEQARIVPA